MEAVTRDLDFKGSGFMRVKHTISFKIMAFLLGMVLVAAFINGAVSITNLKLMKNISVKNSRSLGETAAQRSEKALEHMAKEQLLTVSKEKAAYIDEKFLEVRSYVHGIAQTAKRIYENPHQYPDRQTPPPAEESTELAAQLLYSQRLENADRKQREEILKLGNLQDMLVQYNANNDMVSSTYISTLSGWVIQADYIAYSKFEEKGRAPSYLESEDRQWYKRALSAKEGQYVYSDVIEDVHGGGSCIVCAEPVYKGDEVVAVAGTGSYLNTVNQAVLDTSVNGTGYAFLLNYNGQIMVSAMTEGETAASPDTPADLRKSENTQLADTAVSMTAGFCGVDRILLDGKEVYIAYAPLPTMGWSFAAVMAVEDVISPALETQKHILAMTEETAKQQDQAIGKAIKMITGMVAVVILMLGIAGVAMTRRFTRPILALTRDVKKIGAGNLDYRTNISSGDEIEELGAAFNAMADKVQAYIKSFAAATAEKERIRTELTVAAHLQSDMLPAAKGCFTQYQEFTLAAVMRPAKEVGGDFYDFFMTDEEHLALVVADVSGKGVPAALFMVIAKALLQSNIKREKNLERAFEITNESLCANNKNGMFVTAWAGILDISDGTLTYTNAGHCHPLIKGRDGNVVYLTELGGFVLAGAEGMTYRQSVVRLRAGDILFQCSDGVTEANDCDGALYGEERLKRILELFGSNEPQEVIDAVWNDVCTFEGIAEQFDDITMLAVRFNAEANKKEAWCGTPHIESMPDVIKFMDDILKEETVNKSDRAKLLVAVDELYSNICRYSKASEAEITCHVVPEYVQIVFEDNGVAYNPLENDMPDITQNAEEREIGGLGIYMVRTMMDDVEYENADGKNRLTIKLMR